MTSREDKIRERAEQLWRVAGTPQGRDEEFWHKAEEQINLEEENEKKNPTSGTTSGTR